MKFTITLTGTRPLIMHNARLSNPIDPFAQAMKEVHGKHKKTDDDYRELAKREWLGGVYHTDTMPKDIREAYQVGPYVPSENIERMLVDSAKMTRNGMDIKRGVMISTDFNPLVYDGPRDLATLHVDENYRILSSVKVGVQRVMRCRPMFRAWQVSAGGAIDTEILNIEEFGAIVERGGRLVGLGDWRPRYGRFDVEVSFSE